MAFTFSQGTQVIQGIIIIGLLLGVGALALENFGTSLDLTSGTTGNCNSTARQNCTIAANVSFESQSGLNNFGQQLPNIGLIAAVAVLLGIVIVGFLVTR